MEAFLFCAGDSACGRSDFSAAGKVTKRPPETKGFWTSFWREVFGNRDGLFRVYDTLFSTAALTLQCVGYSPTRPFLVPEYLHGAWDGEKRTTYQGYSLNAAGPAGVRRSREVNATFGQNSVSEYRRYHLIYKKPAPKRPFFYGSLKPFLLSARRKKKRFQERLLQKSKKRPPNGGLLMEPIYSVTNGSRAI